jgi:hypothetical protein
MHERMSHTSRFELARSAIARYLVADSAFTYAARNLRTDFLVTGVDTSLTMKPMIPYLLSWKDGDTESCMDGELIERLDAAEAGRDFFASGRKRKWTSSTLMSSEKPLLRSADVLTSAPTIAYELFAGTGEVAVKIANTFPWLKQVYAFEIDSRLVCKAAHPERAAGRSARELARVPTALVGRILRAGVSNVLSIEHGVSR